MDVVVNSVVVIVGVIIAVDFFVVLVVVAFFVDVVAHFIQLSTALYNLVS
jgi:hypothetical protein